jgi:Lipocalin-like domain
VPERVSPRPAGVDTAVARAYRDASEDKTMFDENLKRIAKVNPTAKARRLVGTWRVVSAQFEYADTGECRDMYGPNPSGYLILTDNGRMMGMLTAADRAAPENEADRAGLFESMMAYSGKFRVEGDDEFITTVDLAWHPAWNRTEQTRFFKLDGDALSITSAQQTHPLFPGRLGRGVLVWRRT